MRVRQVKNSTSTPPRTRPDTHPPEAVAPYMPRARVRAGPSAKPVVIRDDAAGAEGDRVPGNHPFTMLKSRTTMKDATKISARPSP
jgi:hypothetical protein